MTEKKVGKVVEIIGPVIVAAFEGDYRPPIYDALRITSEGFDVPKPISVVVEVELVKVPSTVVVPPVCV